jgi:molybdate transport system substrate-binding protein
MRATIVLAALLTTTSVAGAAEIKTLITTAMDAAIVELVPPFERATGHKVIVSYDPSGGLARRLRNGEQSDMILIASKELDELIKEGRVKARIDVSRTGIGLAVKKGAPRPDVSTPEALKRTLLAARSIGHTAPAGGGITALHIQKVFERLGITEQVAPKVKLAAGGPNGRVSVLITSGQAEIGLQ